jgi:UDP-glucose 4-epimerase
MKVLITGGAGFIGSNLVDFFVNNGHEVAILDNFSTGNRSFCNPKSIIFDQDITKNFSIDFVPDILIHCAAHVSLRESFKNPFFDAEQNILGTIKIANTFADMGTKHILFCSSGGSMISESEDKFPLKEAESPDPKSPYGLSKLCAEKYLQNICKRKNVLCTIFRLSNIYGRRQTPVSETGIVSIFIEKLLSGEKPFIFGDGSQTRDFLHIDDVMSAFFLAIKYEHEGIFNLGSGTEEAIIDVFYTVSRLLGDKEKNFIFRDYVQGELRRNTLDSTKFQDASGWCPMVSFDEGVQDTINWWLQQLGRTQRND